MDMFPRSYQSLLGPSCRAGGWKPRRRIIDQSKPDDDSLTKEKNHIRRV